jgi:hypothetical protein
MEETWSVVRAERDPAVMRTVACAALVGLLSPVTGAGILLACDYIRFGTVANYLYMLHSRILIVAVGIFIGLPAALVAGMGFRTLVALRAHGLSPGFLQPLSTALGAVFGVFVASHGSRESLDVWILSSALNGAVWGMLVAQYALRDQRERPVPR